MRQVLVAMCGGLFLAGCGATIQSKQDAANAVHAMTLAGSGAKTATGNGIDVNATITGKTGTADVTVSTDNGFVLTLVFHHYSADGKNTFDGTLNYTATANIGSSSIDVAWHIQGTVDMTGDYNDHVSVDITETLDATLLAQNSGNITVTMNGSLNADGRSYAYTNESISVNVSP